jgi:hypothetical protein
LTCSPGTELQVPLKLHQPSGSVISNMEQQSAEQNGMKFLIQEMILSFDLGQFKNTCGTATGFKQSAQGTCRYQCNVYSVEVRTNMGSYCWCLAVRKTTNN